MANPYLPSWEYIPDGEPRVFGDRIYIYGSHDTAGSDGRLPSVIRTAGHATATASIHALTAITAQTLRTGQTTSFLLRTSLNIRASIIFLHI